MGTRSGASKKLSGSAMDKLVAGGRLSTDLAQVVHLAFSTTSGAKRPEAFWRELRLPRGRCLEAVDLWELTEHSTGAGLETIEQLRNVSFQGEKQEVSELLGKLRAILPALTVMEVVGVHSELVSCLEVFEGRVRIICDLAFGQRFEGSPPAGVELHPLFSREPDRAWLAELLD